MAGARGLRSAASNISGKRCRRSNRKNVTRASDSGYSRTRRSRRRTIARAIKIIPAAVAIPRPVTPKTSRVLDSTPLSRDVAGSNSSVTIGARATAASRSIVAGRGAVVGRADSPTAGDCLPSGTRWSAPRRRARVRGRRVACGDGASDIFRTIAPANTRRRNAPIVSIKPNPRFSPTPSWHSRAGPSGRIARPPR